MSNKFKVKDRVHLNYRGYITVISNPELIPIHVGDYIQSGDGSWLIEGVECWKNMETGKPFPTMGLLTAYETKGKEVEVVSKDDLDVK